MQTENINNNTELKIGNVSLKSKVILAPMAGITDTILRQIVRMFSGDCLLMSEMVSSEALKFNKEQPIINCVKEEYPLSFQISGHKPEIMAEAAKKLEAISTIIDINMGCPAPKIIKNGDGASLMTNINLASSIISAVKNSVNIPVTVKFRLGWDFNSKNYIEFAQMAENSGADAIIVHGRTRSQMYSGKADWRAIGEIKQVVNIPVIGNGDINSPEKAKECLDTSGCDGIAVGRGILGDPGLINRIEKFISSGELKKTPDITERLQIAALHCKKEVEYRSEVHGIKYMRKFFAHYVRNVRNACKHRHDLVKSETLEQVETIFNLIKEESSNT